MTKKEKIATLEALKKDAEERMIKAKTDVAIQYEKGRVDSLNEAIAVLKNNEMGNIIKEVYIGKEKNL